MKSRGLLGSLASMLALVGLGSYVRDVAPPAPVPTLPQPGEEGHAPPRRRLGGGCGLEFRDDPETLARSREIRTRAHDAEAMERAERKRARVAITRRGLRVVVGPDGRRYAAGCDKGVSW